MVEKQWFGCQGDWTPRFWPQNDITQADLLTSSSSQTNLMQDLEPMDPLPNHQNHFEDVSSELGWLRSNDLGDARLRAHGSPSQPSKIILGMYQVNWDG
jgi:hypothetical protein